MFYFGFFYHRNPELSLPPSLTKALGALWHRTALICWCLAPPHAIDPHSQPTLHTPSLWLGKPLLFQVSLPFTGCFSRLGGAPGPTLGATSTQSAPPQSLSLSYTSPPCTATPGPSHTHMHRLWSHLHPSPLAHHNPPEWFPGPGATLSPPAQQQARPQARQGSMQASQTASLLPSPPCVLSCNAPPATSSRAASSCYRHRPVGCGTVVQ